MFSRDDGFLVEIIKNKVFSFSLAVDGESGGRRTDVRLEGSFTLHEFGLLVGFYQSNEWNGPHLVESLLLLLVGP